MQARHDLKHALMEQFGASPEEHKRIAEILRRAAAEIRATRSRKPWCSARLRLGRAASIPPQRRRRAAIRPQNRVS